MSYWFEGVQLTIGDLADDPRGRRRLAEWIEAQMYEGYTRGFLLHVNAQWHALWKRGHLGGGHLDRKDLIALYGHAGGRCHWCACELGESDWGVDHLVPVTQYGSRDPSNLRISCWPCNKRKGRQPAARFARQMCADLL